MIDEFLHLHRGKTKRIWSDDIDFQTGSIGEETSSEKFKSNLVVNQTTEDSKASVVEKKKGRKRSRGKKNKKKDSSNSKPKELFVHTIKVKGFPATVRRKNIIDFFKPLEVKSVRINKKDGLCYVSFKDESDLNFAFRKNLQFWETFRINIARHNVNRSKAFLEIKHEKAREKDEKYKKWEAIVAETESVGESGRLFVRNLSYKCTQDELEQVFSKYGEITEIHYPIDRNTSLPKGYAYVEYMFPENAARAYEELNGTTFQDRKFHLIPSKPKPEPRLGPGSFNQLANRQADGNQSSFKRNKLLEQKQAAPKGSNWNILFLGQNALADVVSDMRGVDKSKLLTEQTNKEPIAVRLALGDAMVVEEMRKFLVTNGIELDSFDNPQAPRSRTVLIAKNLPASTDKTELSKLFEAHGRVARVIMPPNGLTAIVEMEEAVEAKLAFRKLAYSKFKDSLLYLEWAPINVFREKSLDEQEKTDLKQLEEIQTGTKILVKNIPFEATVQELKKIFAAFGELNFVRIPKKIDGQHRGFGFVNYLTKADAMRAFRSLCHSTHLYGRKLVLEWAKADDSTATTATPTTPNETRKLLLDRGGAEHEY